MIKTKDKFYEYIKTFKIFIRIMIVSYESYYKLLLYNGRCFHNSLQHTCFHLGVLYFLQQ